MANGLIKDITGYHIHVLSSSNLFIDKMYDDYIVFPVITAGGLLNLAILSVYPGVRKSRTARYQNRPKDFSSQRFEPAMRNCEPLPVVNHLNIFFLSAHGQELSVPRVYPSL